MDLDPLAIVRRRVYEQRLTGEPLRSAGAAVARLGAMQAQEFGEAKWSIAERTGGGSDAAVEEAFARGEILRTHMMRPTWHFVAPADIRWLLELTAPRVHMASRYRYRQLQLDETLLSRGADVIGQALGGGRHLTRAELAARLGDAGIDAEGPRLAYIVMWAELEALICSGPRRGRQHTYALLEERAPRAPRLTRPEALAELALRYFTSHGPARVKDFTQWSGLTAADAKAGLDDVGSELEAATDDDGTAWFAGPETEQRSWAGPPSPVDDALLIPMYDEIVSGYRDLRIVYAKAPPREGLMDRPIVIAGKTLGSWRRVFDGKGAVVEATLFKRLTPAERKALARVVERFGAFLGVPVKLRMEVLSG